MEEQSLSLSFGNSLTEDVAGMVGEYAELGLDVLLEDGLLKDIPMISTAVALYKIGKSIHERHHIAKLISFLNEINKGIADEEQRKKYREKFNSNEKFRNQELEYILILIERYISHDKPQMLAKLYLAYLDAVIIWEEFTMYAEVIDRLLSGDYNALQSSKQFITVYNLGSESLLRLMALGLLVEESRHGMWTDDGRGGFVVTATTMQRAANREKKYVRTEFGHKLVEIMSRF